MIFSRIILFALYVLLVAAGNMWRFADDWGGVPSGRRVYLALCASWKWWLLVSFTVLLRDVMIRRQFCVPGDLVVIAIALIMSVAAYLGGKAAGSTPE